MFTQQEQLQRQMKFLHTLSDQERLVERKITKNPNIIEIELNLIKTSSKLAASI